LTVESHGSAEWRRTRASLTGAARRIDAHGTRERRHRAYALDRQLYAWWLAEFDWMKTRGKRTARGRAVPGQGRLILPGAPSYANRARYPRDHRGRADHRAARVHLQLAAAARRAIAKEWGRYNVNVNCVAFGFIQTRLTEATADGDAYIDVEGRQIKVGVNPQLLEMLNRAIPLGRAGTPDEAAGSVVMFTYPEADYVSGQVIVTGGGFEG
jgi:NAD(P)-dependent dehydrogenase (short-subunit alcohol dehydrogenase family)